MDQNNQQRIELPPPERLEEGKPHGYRKCPTCVRWFNPNLCPGEQCPSCTQKGVRPQAEIPASVVAAALFLAGFLAGCLFTGLMVWFLK